MRKFTAGSGADTTAAVQALLAANSEFRMYTLFVIKLAKWNEVIPQGGVGIVQGPSFFKNTWLLTDAPAPVVYNLLGNFSVANIKHGTMNFGVGYASDIADGSSGDSSFDVVWVPSPLTDFVLPVNAGPWGAPGLTVAQGVREGFFDGALIYVYKVFMTTPGDANTYGATLLTFGATDEIDVDGLEFTFKCVDPMTHLQGNIPSQVISSNSRFAPADSLIYKTNNGTDGRAYRARFSDSYVNQYTSFDFLHPLSPHPTGFYDGAVFQWMEGPLMGMRRSVRHNVTDLVNSLLTFYLAEPFPYEQNVYAMPFFAPPWGFAFGVYNATSLTTSDANYDGFENVPAVEDGF